MTKNNYQISLAENRLLAMLSQKELARVAAALEPVHLPKGKILYQIGDQITYVYFPVDALISLLSTTTDGAAIEVGVVSNEGLAGISVLLGGNEMEYQTQVQIPGEGFRLKVGVLQQEFSRCGNFQEGLLHYLHILMKQVAQSAVCNRFHTITQRLCRWLLIAHDRTQSDTIRITQETLSQMLGAPRTLVTMTARKLQRAGLISYQRGTITMLNRPQMEKAACECYSVIRKAFARHPKHTSK